MKLFYLTYAGASDETGKNYPQVQKIYPELDYTSSQSIYRILEQGLSFNDASPFIDYGELRDGSLFTDFISSSMFNLNGYLISERTKNIFESLTLPSFKFYAVPIKSSDGTKICYYWMHFLFSFKNTPFKDIQDRYIKFEKSNFWITKHLKRIEQVKITSIEDMNEIDIKLTLAQSISASVLHLHKEFITAVPDVFKIPLLSSTDWIIKEHVKNLLFENKLTGFIVKEVDNLVIG